MVQDVKEKDGNAQDIVRGYVLTLHVHLCMPSYCEDA